MSRPLHVLIIEDSEDDALLLVRELRRGNFIPIFERIDTASALSTALDQQDWDIILADYALPTFSAPLALALLQERGLDLPFIIVSGTIEEEAAVAALKAGAHDFIVKHRLARLLPAIERELRKASERRARQQTEHALHESESRFQRLADNAPDIIYRYRLVPAPGFEYVSPAVTAITGYTPAEHYANPNLWNRLVQPDDRQLLDILLRSPVKRDAPLIIRWIRKDGTIIWTDHRLVPIHDATGTVVAVEGIARDISAQVQTETALRLSEQRYRSLVETSPDAILLTNLDGTIVLCNQQAAQVLGYPTVEELLWHSLVAAIAPEDQARAKDDLQQTIELGRINTVEYTLLTPDGNRVPVEFSASVVQSPAGPPTALISVVRDISARKQAEAQIQRQMEHLISLRMIDRMISANLDLRVMLNVLLDQVTAQLQVDAAAVLLLDAANQQLGYAAGRGFYSEAMARSQLRLGEGYAGRAALERRLVSIPDLAAADDFVRAPLVNGEGFHTYYGMPLIAKGHVQGVLDIFHRAPLIATSAWRDVLETLASQAAIAIDNARLYEAERQARTAAEAAQAALRESEARFRLIAENAHDLIALLNSAGYYIYVSPSFQSVLGYPLETFLTIRPPDLLHPDDRIRLAERTTTSPVAFRIRKADGSWSWFEGTRSAVTWQGEQYLLEIAHDITARKHAEEALEAERAMLARRVDERTAELRMVNAELLRAARLKDEFLASMSHELRTPLNAILGLSEAVQEEVYGVLSAQQRTAIHNIEQSGRHLLTLINDILDLAKVEAGKLEVVLEPVTVPFVCQASVQFIKQEALKKRISVSSTIDSAVTIIQADERRLKQILVNLLSNAVKFTPAGGAVGLEVVGDPGQQALHFTVWDTGIGIDQADLARLFQPFVQLDSSLARQYSGTGLGLALVARMVDAHGGSINVESVVGQGSRFTVTLPWSMPSMSTPEARAARLEPSRDAAPPGPVLPGERSGTRVLIVADTPAAATQISQDLVALGTESMILPHGAQALAWARAGRPDLIIVDMEAPDSAGWEVLAQLKADPSAQVIPVLVFRPEDAPMRGHSLGAAEELVKPIAQQQMQEALERMRLLSPRPDQHQASNRGADQAGAAPLVLLAEDNEANITTLSEYLRLKGYRVVVARNGAEAIDRARALHPDVIVMDVQMPGMDGLEATRRIRADADLATIPIIAVTALALPGDQERCLAAGANDYLSKPVSLKGLATAIRAQWEQVRSPKSRPEER